MWMDARMDVWMYGQTWRIAIASHDVGEEAFEGVD